MRHLTRGWVGAWSLVCLLGSGAWAWQININGTANRADQAHAVAVDPAGDVVSAGVTVNRHSVNDFTVVKVDGTSGDEVWRVVIAGTRLRGLDRAVGVAVDGAGDVLAAGWLANADTGYDFTVVKLAADGAERWRYVFNGPPNGDDQAYAIAVDAAGDVLAAGYTEQTVTGAWDFTVVKVAGDSGAERWRYVLNPADDFDLAFAVTVDAAGDVVAAGATQTPGTSTDFTVVKLAGADGAERWRAILNGPAQSFDEAHAVTVDGAGDVVAAGVIAHSSAHVDFCVIKLAGGSGAEQWRAVLTGTAEGDDQAAAVTVDAAGDVLAAGWLANADSGDDFTVVKLAGSDGAERWRAVLNGTINGEDRAQAVTLDGAGDVVAAGVTGNNGTGADVTAVKLSGPSGAERWRAAIDGTGEGMDHAAAVTVDAAGDVVAAGGTSNTGTPFVPRTDFTVVKRRGTDGGDF